MDYPSLSLSTESIQNAFKIKQPKSISYIPGQPRKNFQFEESTIQKCEQCSHQASNSQTLHYHIITKHSETKEKCNVCEYSHGDPRKMKFHFKWEHQGLMHTCNQCDFKTLKSETLRSHILYKHSELKVKCVDCDYSHPASGKVKAHHRQVHLGIKRLERRIFCRQSDCQYLGMDNCPESKHKFLYCEECEYSTQASSYLKIHVRNVHSSEKGQTPSDGLLIKCEQCDYKTRWSSTLIRHKVNNHMDEQTKQQHINWKECKFEKCLFKTPIPVVLKRHIEWKHEGIVHFRCNFMNCAYATGDKRSFNEHTGTHNSVVKCHICGKNLARFRDLKHHIRNVHETVRLLKCKFFECAFETNDKKGMREHTLKHNMCHLCKVTFSRPDNLKIHMRNIQMKGACPEKGKRLIKVEPKKGEPNKCNLCKVTFLCPKSLKRHIGQIQVNGGCPETRKRPIKVEHIKGEPYKCHLCNITFSMPKTFRTHLRKIEVNGDCPKTYKKHKKDEPEPEHKEDT